MVILHFKKNFLPVLCIIFSCFLMFYFPNEVSVGITNGLKICFSTVIPSLFPFMVLSLYIANSNSLTPISKLFAPVTRLIFKQNENAAPVILMGLIGGFPVGIKMTATLFSKGEITKNEAQRLATFCMNSGPAFAISAVGANMLGNKKCGVIIFASLCISYLICGFISSFFRNKNDKPIHKVSKNQLHISALSASVTDAVNSILSICAWIVLFSALTQIIFQLKFSENTTQILLGALEVTKGTTLLSGNMPVEILTFFIGFGGFCVHAQVFSYVKSIGLSYVRFFVSRVLGGGIASIVCHIILYFIPVEINVISQSISRVEAYSVSIPALLITAVMCIVMIFDIDTKKKV